MAKLKWRALKELNTAAVVPWDRENLFRCDPYLVWADATTVVSAKQKLNIAVLVELATADDLPDFFQRLNQNADAPDQLRFLPNGFEPDAPSRFITGLVDRPGLAALVTEVVERRIQRFTLQNSRLDIATETEAMWTEWRTKEKSATPEEAPPRSTPLPGTYLGIIDDGLPVLKLRDAIQFLDHPAHFWDQGWQPPHLAGTEASIGTPTADDPYWQVCWEFLFWMNAGITISRPPRGFLYGRRLKRLNASTARQNDQDEYFLSNYFSPPPRETHGAGVLGLLAPWMSGARGPASWPPHVSGLAMVQLPTATVVDTSGGSLAMRVIDGLRYILWQEACDGTIDRPIVANVSYGVHAGPHDGTSMFERALAEMLENHPRLHVVLPAGNSARIGCHARRELSSKGQAGDQSTLLLEVLPDNSRDTFVEFWLPQGGSVALSIRPPGSDQSYEIREDEAKICFDPAPTAPGEPRRIHFGAVYAKEVAQGTTGPMALLAIGCTRAMHRPAGDDARGLNQQPRRDVLGTPGLWTLTVRNLKTAPVTVDAWVERDDAPPDAPRENRQAYFPDSCCETARLGNATPEGTLNGIATLVHERLHVIGAMRTDGMLSGYSAAGRGRSPALRNGPDAVAVADWSEALPGLRTAGFVKGAITRINGTSAACAVYTRALAQQLAQDPTKLPRASKPQTPPPEITCTPESQPEASADLRGQDLRQLFPFEVDL